MKGTNTSHDAAPMLFGREPELSAISELLEHGSGALVVCGEAGIGKSALLAHAAADARGQVLRVAGIQSEADLPFAALHLLLRPVLDHTDALPPQQAAALRGALGVGAATKADRFLVGLATLNLLVELSLQGPVLCLIDDAQWLDGESADALLFAARRLHHEPVVVLFATRTQAFAGHGLPGLHIRGLDAEAARELLSVEAADLPPAVRDQLITEAQGNPLALRELPRMLTPDQRTGARLPLSFSLGCAHQATDRVLIGFRDRVATLPAATRTCLLVAALDHHDRLDRLSHAVELLDASLADFAAAERAGLIRVGPDGLTFHHPLVSTAVLLACDIAERMAAHRALARTSDADRRAWHLAAITQTPDEQVAQELENMALRARSRGGQTAMSAAYARAAELSTDPADAVRRWVVAAHAAIEAGLWQRAAELVDEARARAASVTVPGPVLAELAYARAVLEVENGRPLAGVRLLHDGIEATDDLPTKLTLLSVAGYYTWASAAHPDQLVLARRTEQLCPAGDDSALTAVRTINHAFRLILQGDAVTIPSYRLPDLDENVPYELRFLIGLQGLDRADIDGMLDSATALVQQCRAEGRLGRLPQTMVLLAIAELLDGRHRSARATAGAGLALATDVGQPMWRGYLAAVHAWLSAAAGDRQECESMAQQAICDADHRQWLMADCWSEYARATLDLGLGHYRAVLDRADRVMTGPLRHAFLWRYLWPDYIEAAVRAGEPSRAREYLDRFTQWAESTGRPAPRAVLQRARALLAPDHCAAALYDAALALHAEDTQPFDQARTRLVYGEWLRRNKRRAQARVQLESAMETFDQLGAAPWAARAATELRATGTTVPHRGDQSPLTPQELQVVRLAVTGASNREIGAQLFLSPRTVASHLYKAFPKLGVASRAELARLPLPDN
ncbi:AAA family ATPase [Nocardia sp. NPDC050793]|uniref:AAA family ATPase n=1 Tax=Nocardia sp. NPDC050793 TaxID=3155159 RepID=UPI003408B174